MSVGACGWEASEPGEPLEPLGQIAEPLSQELRLPFEPGHTWYICQSYVGFSHKSNRSFDIGWTKASCNAGNNDTGGKRVVAPAAGTITRLPNTAPGGDFMCLRLTGGGSVVFGHVKPDVGIAVGAKVTAGQPVAAVRTSTDPAGQNAGIAHLHYEAFSGDGCYTGTAEAFTGAWRMKCAPDLPYNATYGFYNGTPIRACAPDAGVVEGDAGEDDGEAPASPSPSPSSSSSSSNDEPSHGSPRRLPGSAGAGCRVGTTSTSARSAIPSGVLLLLAMVGRRRRRSER